MCRLTSQVLAMHFDYVLLPWRWELFQLFRRCRPDRHRDSTGTGSLLRSFSFGARRLPAVPVRCSSVTAGRTGFRNAALSYLHTTCKATAAAFSDATRTGRELPNRSKGKLRRLVSKRRVTIICPPMKLPPHTNTCGSHVLQRPSLVWHFMLMKFVR